MALEAIRVLVGEFGDGDEGLVGRLLMIDTRAMRFETLRYAWDPDNPLSGRGSQTRAPKPQILMTLSWPLGFLRLSGPV